MNLILDMKNGRSGCIDECFFGKTYAGLMAGKPNRQVNLEILEQCQNTPQKIWPADPIVVLDLESYLIAADEKFPPIVCSARVISYQPARNADADGSALVVIWFQEESESIKFDLLKEKLKQTDWAQLARDFNW